MKNWPAVPEAPVVRAPQSERGGNAVITAGGVILGLLALSIFSGTHLIFALIAVPVVIAMAWSNPVAAIGILPVWMVAMGLIRRITPGGGNVTFSGDPVLIIGPIALLVMWALVASSREAGRMTPLARWVMFFNVAAFLEAFNPKQGSLLTGLGGLLFVLIPTAAFWIGRRFAEPILIMRVIWTVAILGLVEAIYGLIQQFVGFPSWDLTWIAEKGYVALSLGNNATRAFGSFSSAEEYASFLSVAAVAWVALFVRGTRWPVPLHLAVIGTILVALFYESQRTSFFLVFFAIGVMTAARLRMRPISVALAGAMSITLLIVAAGALNSSGGGNNATSGPQSATQTFAGHQLAGVACPTCKGSSLGGHVKNTEQGIKAAFKNPFGRGTGSTTLASARYTGKSKNNGTEFDPGNMGIALGLPGVIIYVMLVSLALATAYRLATRRRDVVGYFVMGLLAATLFQWTNGDLYSVCWLVWLFLGFADRLLADTPAPEPTALATPQPAPGWRRPGDPRRIRSVF